MRVLAIDTALESCSVGILDARRGEMLARDTRPMLRGHAEALMPMIDAVMRRAGGGFAALDRIAVTVGPGSFTGLRVGIAAARAIGLAARKPVAGLTTLAAFAAPLLARDDRTGVAAAIDARHDHVYLEVVGPGGRSLVPPCIVPIREAVRAAEIGPVRLAGSAAAAMAALWDGAEPPVDIVESRAPDIDWVARLGAAAADPLPAPKPLYLRPPDAHPQDAGRLPRR